MSDLKGLSVDAVVYDEYTDESITFEPMWNLRFSEVTNQGFECDELYIPPSARKKLSAQLGFKRKDSLSLKSFLKRVKK
jgi:hypothetical protein